MLFLVYYQGHDPGTAEQKGFLGQVWEESTELPRPFWALKCSPTQKLSKLHGLGYFRRFNYIGMVD